MAHSLTLQGVRTGEAVKTCTLHPAYDDLMTYRRTTVLQDAPLRETLAAAVAAVQARSSLTPDLALILGSGLGPLADEIEPDVVIPYADLPGFAPSTAPGHAGQLVLGTLGGRRVVAMKGRIHFYEGVTAAQAAFPVRLMHALGAGTLLVSNACGGLNPNWRAGDLMLQLDFVNFTFANPLVGPNDPELGPRFPVTFDAYDPAYLELARETARAENITLREGVYLAVGGPSYATRAATSSRTQPRPCSRARRPGGPPRAPPRRRRRPARARPPRPAARAAGGGPRC